jgi:hypothetical protein
MRLPFHIIRELGMARQKRQRLRIDKRDLPADYDPHYFYEYRIMQRAQEADGIEGLIYRYIPWTIIRSFAFAIDPFSGFKMSLGKISPVARTRKRSRLSVLDARVVTKDVTVCTQKSLENYQDIPGRVGPLTSLEPPYHYTVTQRQGAQGNLWDTSMDTTYRTRAIGYTMGEFEFNKVQVFSPPRSIVTTQVSEQFWPSGGSGFPDILNQQTYRRYAVGPTSATYPQSRHSELLAAERNTLIAVMQKNALSMYKGINPQHRNYTLFRNIAELKDLPQSIATMRETARNISRFEPMLLKDAPASLRAILHNTRSLAKDIPSQYLSYHFGWKQLVSDVMDLLVKPAKISKQIDFLIRRSGKPTTYRSKRQIVSAQADGVPGFVYELLECENKVRDATSLVRTIDLAMVINTTFDFPQINYPIFRKDLFLRKLGVYPSFTDIYNLTPWTWLVDWFTGLGTYIEVIDEVNKDSSIINWGFLTGKSRVEVTTNHSSEAVSVLGKKIGSADWVTTESIVGHNHSSTLVLDLQLRKSLSTLMDVRVLTDIGSLTPFQQSILGALLAQRLR